MHATPFPDATLFMSDIMISRPAGAKACDPEGPDDRAHDDEHDKPMSDVDSLFSGSKSGQSPLVRSPQALRARNATLLGRNPKRLATGEGVSEVLQFCWQKERMSTSHVTARRENPAFGAIPDRAG
jgi:hypothetical protein